MKKSIEALRKIRASIMKKIKPRSSYFMAVKSVKPLSRKFGFDRGTPIDRYYIEKFLEENKKDIKGRALEVVDSTYTKKFGGKKVIKSDVIDNNSKNKKATILADLKDMKNVKSNSFDTLVITHTFGMIDDYDSAIKECYRILKPSGVLLVTVSSFSPTHDIENNFWRFTYASAKYVFGKHFKKLNVKTYGNVLTGQSFWAGLAQEELTREELDYNDPNYPVIITVEAKK